MGVAPPRFVDLRDRAGLTQVAFDPEHSGGVAFHRAETIRSEWPIKVSGVVRERPEGQDNEKLATGEVEVLVSDIEVLNTAKTPVFRSRTMSRWLRTCACAIATWTCVVPR